MDLRQVPCLTTIAQHLHNYPSNMYITHFFYYNLQFHNVIGVSFIVSRDLKPFLIDFAYMCIRKLPARYEPTYNRYRLFQNIIMIIILCFPSCIPSPIILKSNFLTSFLYLIVSTF